MTQKARFISGAVCPSCQLVDKLVLEDIDGVSTRRCVRCGFNDSLELESDAELADRQQAENDTQTGEWQPIRFKE
ncbi:MAG: YheV family putative metal-binding protein [Pseudomonadales bacterium]|jgi:uncharacterized metal-binding protein (TIGR02443 family)|nr:YheV family putative metal-binding protein [Pseudomonadales bacterium]MDG1442605.1 YheV family putative metal-binding protein [Pseudomonadales bacterium]